MMRVVFVIAGVMVSGVITVGLMLVGGPQQARDERADERALSEIKRLHQALQCTDGGDVLPMSLEPRLINDFCGRAFVGSVRADLPKVRYGRLSDVEYELCVDYTNSLPPEHYRLRSLPAFDVELGCLRGALRP